MTNPLADSITEKTFQQLIINLAHLRGWLTYHTHNSKHSARGYPDLTLVRQNRIVFAELKTTRGQLTPDQQKWLQALENTGVEVYVWKPNDWPEIETTLQ